MSAPEGTEVDHIDGNTFDNRRSSNLRLCTHHQNLINKKIQKNNITGFKGVVYREKNKKYSAQIQCNNKSIHLGMFSNPIDAALAYNAAALKYHGEFARLNEL
jgi:hypothetical protein